MIHVKIIVGVVFEENLHFSINDILPFFGYPDAPTIRKVLFNFGWYNCIEEFILNSRTGRSAARGF